MTESVQGTLSMKGLRVLVGGLMTGVGGLAVAVLVVRPPRPAMFALGQTKTLWLGVLLALIAGAVGLLALLSRVLVERSAANVRGGGLEKDALMADFATLTMVRAAIIEGLGLLGAVVYLVADLGIGLGLALVSLIGLALLLPSAGRFEAFHERVTRPQ